MCILLLSQDAYNTVSRYYGLLILGMSLFAVLCSIVQCGILYGLPLILGMRLLAVYCGIGTGQDSIVYNGTTSMTEHSIAQHSTA